MAHRPRLLGDDGASCIAVDLATWLEDKSMEPVRGAQNPPQPQGKIERRHRTFKNRTLLENHHPPGALEAAIGDVVDHDNNRRVRKSQGNVTSADVSFGRAQAILEERKIKEETIRKRRLFNQSSAA